MSTYYIIMSTLFDAAKAGDYAHAQCQSLLREGHQLDLDYPLFYAALRGRTNICSLLLNNSATIDYKDDNGNTPLMCASQQGHLDTVKMLHERGADVFATIRGGASPITSASQLNRAETVQYLVEEAGVGVDTVSGVRSLYTLTHYIPVHCYSKMVAG